MKLTFLQATECDRIRSRVLQMVKVEQSSCKKSSINYQVKNKVLKSYEYELKNYKLILEQLLEHTDQKTEKVSILHNLLNVERLLSGIMDCHTGLTDDFATYCKMGLHFEPNNSSFN